MPRPGSFLSRLPCCLPSAADVDHAAGGLEKLRFADVMARFFLLHGSPDELRQIRIAAAALQHAIQIMLALRKEAGTNFSVRGEPHPAAVAAKRLGHPRDDSHLAHAVVEGVAHRGFT